MELSNEITTVAVIQRHITVVRKYLLKLAQELEMRANNHDMSKYQLDEFGGFVEINRVARQYPYGSVEYKNSLKDNQAVALHYSRNSHHPEFYFNGVDGMTLLDILEMVCDWKAANEVYNNEVDFQTALSMQSSRFHLTDAQIIMIQLIAEALQ